MPDFLLPDLGEGLEEAEIITWLVRPGDQVAVDEVIVEVETAKAVVELPVPFAGTVARLHAAPGTVLSVGQPLITVTASPSVPDPAGSGNVLVGYGTSAAPARAIRAGRRRDALRRPASPAAAHMPPAASQGRVPVISPLVRKLARDAGVDVNAVAGTGPAGLVRRADVQRVIDQRVTGRPAVHQPSTGQPATGQPAVRAEAVPVRPAASADPGERRIPLRGARRAAAEKLSRSRREIPEVTVWVDVDATALLDARRALNAGAGQPVSVLALLSRFALLGLRRYPELNGRVDAAEIVIPGHVHLGFAAQTERGLIVPVVRDAHRMTTRELGAALAASTAAAREGALAPAGLVGGTFTVNNYGVFGVDGSTPIINHPEVAMLGMGRIIDRPWIVGGQVTARKICQLTLAFDHRVCDGGTAGGFLRYVADCMESPLSALGDM